ncbi:MAG: type II toxin-antitoxin system HicB family antitoxin [Flavobacteriales bacterium]|nr:type II toxin-antitoxin system HicB family antitoxin [Flavobacteriales bacterium]
MMRQIQLTAHVERDPETGLYIGMVPSIPGAHTQAKSLDELQANLKEVVELCMEEMTPEDIDGLPQFVGLQSFSIAV